MIKCHFANLSKSERVKSFNQIWLPPNFTFPTDCLLMIYFKKMELIWNKLKFCQFDMKLFRIPSFWGITALFKGLGGVWCDQLITPKVIEIQFYYYLTRCARQKPARCSVKFFCKFFNVLRGLGYCYRCQKV